MSADPLPDDLRAWPDDPRRILGVPENVDEQSLRRAYHRLIRRFNPERFPEQFMKVREAYEFLQRFTAFFRVEAVHDPQEEQPATETAGWERVAASPEVDRELVETVWRQAVQGSPPEALHHFHELAERHPEDETLALRCHWLHRVQSALGDNSTATADPNWFAERLTEQAKRHGPGSRSWFLLLQALELKPDGALTDSCTTLLTTPQLRNGLFPLLNLRWRAAAAAGRWDVVREDLDRLRPQPGREDIAWMHMLLQAADHTAWSDAADAQAVTGNCATELQPFAEYELTYATAFDRYFLLCSLNEHRPFIVDPHRRRLWELVRDSWTLPADHLRSSVVAVVHDWIDQPTDALELLDDFGRVFPLHLGLLHDLFRQLAQDQAWLHAQSAPVHDHNVIYQHLIARATRDFASFRRGLAAMIALEFVSLDAILDVGFSTPPEDELLEWCQTVYDDLPLRTLQAGVAVYWR